MTSSSDNTSPGEPLPDEIELAVFDIQALPRERRAGELEALCAKHADYASTIRLLGRMTMTIEPSVPDRIGPYRIVELLGEGGMGTVYVAEQTEPVKRRVALKVVKLGMDSKSVLARFEVERRALAVMNHDAIARVFDAGSTEQGQPYFVMEYVDGLPLNDYCERHRLNVSERISLFREICGGVQHAHQKGVIHRDLKPGNVLVRHVEGQHVPKIIDFGLARATDRDSADWSLVTIQGQMLGTPAYMSPEQAAGHDAALDTRTDVYALGVMLYELLSGQLPFSNEELGPVGLAEIHRTIREIDPPRPSTRISHAGDRSSEHASHCGTTTTALRRALRGDLDWVVMRAIAKEPGRRYGSAGDFAADLLRFQNHEPVLAKPPSLGYRTRKFVRRYRVQVAALAVVLATLAVGVTGVWLSFVDAKRARQTAEVNLSRYELLSKGVRLRNIRTRAEQLVPAWPENEKLLRQLLEKDWRDLRDSRAGLAAALQKLRDKAAEPDPRAEAERRRRHPKATLLAEAILERDARQLAADVRAGKAEPPEAQFDEAWKEEPTWVLENRVQNQSGLNRRVYGREAEALAIARYVFEKEPSRRQALGFAIAYGLLALGREDDAKKQMLAALANAGAAEKRRVVAEFRRAMQTERRRAVRRLPRLNRKIAALEREIATQVSWGLPTDSEQFLHDTLTRLIADIDAFEREVVPDLRRRQAWASRIHELSVVRYADRWSEARRAIRKADGVVASTEYAAVPIDLVPQVGLVPIGMNPRTKLWEFYHLASVTADASELEAIEIPAHGSDGSIPVRSKTGIVFILVPGGKFLMGAQPYDPELPHHDRLALVGRQVPVAEVPVMPVTLAPYFLSRYELTQGQWKHLSGDRPPSYYVVGSRYSGAPGPIDYNYPVDSVQSDASQSLFREFGLILPTEAQWERACRAGTSTPWSTGAEPESLRGHANVRDEASQRFYPRNGLASVPWDDGAPGPAAVGSFAPNPWGFHDMHGNLSEWCRGGGSYEQDAAPRDGERRWLGTPLARTQRGGSYGGTPRQVRSSARRIAGRDWGTSSNGVRAARWVFPRSQ